MTVLNQGLLPLPLWRQGKVREVYEVDDDHLLLVASDRVSAFDVIMHETVPHKGAVLTQLAAFWFTRIASLGPTHFLTANWDDICQRVPQLLPYRAEAAGRSTLVRRTTPIPYECVIRGYLSGSAWKEYRASGTLAGESLPLGLCEADRLDPPLFSPATKAESGHDINIPYRELASAIGDQAAELRRRSYALYETARAHAESVGLILADTKFEFGMDAGGQLTLIDEILTPDSSRYWPASTYQPGQTQPSFDKQPLRDYLAELADQGLWNSAPPPPPLPPEVISAMAERYLTAYRLLTGESLPEER